MHQVTQKQGHVDVVEEKILVPTPSPLHLHPTPYTLVPTPSPLHPTFCSLDPTPWTHHLYLIELSTVHHTPYTINLM